MKKTFATDFLLILQKWGKWIENDLIRIGLKGKRLMIENDFVRKGLRVKRLMNESQFPLEDE